MDCGSSNFTARVGGIAAKNLQDSIYVCAVYEAEGTTYCTGILPYSVAAYCESFAAGTGNIQTLAQATCIYSYYARLLLGA